MTVTICPPGIAQGAEFQKPHTRGRSTHNNYGRLWRTRRRDNARPGDVLTAMTPFLRLKGTPETTEVA